MQGKMEKRLKSALAVIGLTGCGAVYAAPGDEQIQHQQEQQKARQAQIAPKAPDIRLAEPLPAPSRITFPAEKPCFTLQRVSLSGQQALPHWVPLQRLANQAVGHCVGVQGINQLMGTLQNRLINHGWVTTRVLAPPQDLRQGELKLLIVPGKIRRVELAPGASRYVSLYPTMPAHSGDLLDLRDIEQGLENLQRLPGVEAKMALRPAEKPGESDIIIERTQRRFWRLGAWLDDSGTESTGRYQSGIMLALDNPTSLSDLFYLTASRDLGFAGRKSSKSLTGHYSVPVGWWQFGLTASDYDYHQTVAGYSRDFLYAGKSRSLDVQASRVLHRNASSKTLATYDVLVKESRNFINDTEVVSQQRRTSAWRLGLSHRHYIGPATLDAGVSYQRGTRWFGALPAWEESYHDSTYATALAKILTWQAALTVPFSLSTQYFNYNMQYRRQMSNTPLTPQDEFAIGNRWTVRGFDGERTLSASRGWTLQNTLAWQTPLPAQEFYLGADYGEVSGNSAIQGGLPGRHLAGGVTGLRGAIAPANLSYDLFAGIPLSKPEGFKTDPATFGFSLNWNY
ncbi:ShlB/FhaC/HecB family hemolysin secretion/activation protein [Erwinia sp. 198]|uniref:ShlB/FhaC/HecB family hemolysin secretion/activation protein n=1 Tax=Erwinia sp. 198 TaxID=2022746 RepID=UPI000F661BFE|nr:ShlB/FhaC/HecB family hemolysin secretion/activation protein [Erwinia sp. 198]RRZ87220.1 ShlB/FhaC/HecB family hemolysin secretion/activation protein [Erwinia sp. 198]